MRIPLLIAVCTLGACAQQPANDGTANGGTSNTVDMALEDAAPVAQPEAEPGDVATPVPPTPAPAPTAASEDPDAGSAQAAATVVERYYALIGERNYGAAWNLWGNNGSDSGMTRAAFAESFAKFAEYHAEVGAPGRVDPGAGQRYVSVPVRVYGTLRDGKRPFAMRGEMVLHRTVVDGASAEQRSWRIRSADIKPRPGEVAQNPPQKGGDTDTVSVARYRCVDGSRLNARFEPDKGQATLRSGGQQLAVLNRQRTGSGIRYTGGGYVFGGKGDAMTLNAPGKPPVACTAIR